MSRRTRAEWRAEVLRSPRITDSVRVLLLTMGDEMDAQRFVTIPSVELQRRLNRSQRRIAERVAMAQTAGFLTKVHRGHSGQVAVYQGTFPDRS